MSDSQDAKQPIAERYAQRRLAKVVSRLGAGKDGSVFKLSNSLAVKIHDRQDSFQQELLIYRRLHDMRATSVAGFRIPRLRGYMEDLRAIEMTIVHPPYVLDFASAVLDHPYDFEQDVIDEWHARLEEKFGVFLYDLHRHNIKFRGE